MLLKVLGSLTACGSLGITPPGVFLSSAKTESKVNAEKREQG